MRDFIESSFAASAPSREVYRASASRWCQCRTLTAIGVDGVRTVERERARRRWTRRARGVREVLEAAVLAGGGE